MSTTVTVYGVPYLYTLPGALKVLEVLFDFIGMICIASSYLTSRGDAFLAASITGLIVSAVLLALYLTNVIGKFSTHVVLRIEFIFCAVWTIFYLVVSSLVIDYYRWTDAYLAGGIFGLLAMVCYLMDAIHKYRSAPLFV